MKKQYGFTAIELIIVVVLLGILGLAAVTTCSRCCGAGDPEDLKAQAQKYATDLGYKVIGVSCMSHDSDGDGYISCTIRYEESTGIVKMLALECAGGMFNYKEGCKQPKLRLPTAGQ